MSLSEYFQAQISAVVGEKATIYSQLPCETVQYDGGLGGGRPPVHDPVTPGHHRRFKQCPIAATDFRMDQFQPVKGRDGSLRLAYHRRRSGGSIVTQIHVGEKFSRRSVPMEG